MCVSVCDIMVRIRVYLRGEVVIRCVRVLVCVCVCESILVCECVCVRVCV